MYPCLYPFSFVDITANPSDKSQAPSNCGLITILPFRSTYPRLSSTITTKRLVDLLCCAFDKQHRDKINKAMKVLIASFIVELLRSFATDYRQSDRRAAAAMVWASA